MPPDWTSGQERFTERNDGIGAATVRAMILRLRCAALAVAALCAGCSEPAGDGEVGTQSPRAFFAELQDGAVVQAPVELRFDVENFEIAPVGVGLVRAGEGHFHLGVDADGCVAAGEIIPPAAPWIHFSDGGRSIELDLAPGTHTLFVQVADAEHRALDAPGLCQRIRLAVEGGGTSDP